MARKSDWELLPEYYEGQNEPVGIWVERHYEYFIFNGYKYHQEKATIEDAIQDVANKLIEIERVSRKGKFKPVNENIRGAVWMRIQNRIIDLQRAEKRKKIVAIGDEQDFEQETDDEKFLLEERKEKIEKFKSQLSNEEQEFLTLMFINGSGKLESIIEELNLSKNQGRVIKQRIKRKIKRYLLNG